MTIKKPVFYFLLFILHVSFFTCLNSLVFAQTNIPNEYPSLYKGARPLGMGNAFIAMEGIDENAIFYNPAAVNDYKKEFHFRLVSPLIDFSPGSIGLISDLFNLGDSIDAQTTAAGKGDTFNNFVNQHAGEYESLDAQFMALTMMHKWFAVSLLVDSRTTLSLRDSSSSNIQVNSRSDAGGVLSGAYGFFNDYLELGANLKILYRLSVNNTVTTADVVSTSSFSNTLPRNSGIGVGFDLGVKGKIPTGNSSWLKALRTTVGATWQDVGNTRFTGAAPNTPQSVSAGLGFHPMIGSWELSIENDFRQLNQSQEFILKYNVGAEMLGPLMKKFFRPSFRVGGNQGYITGGLTMDFKYVRLDFATYGEEVGQTTREGQNRRLVGNISFGI